MAKSGITRLNPVTNFSFILRVEGVFDLQLLIVSHDWMGNLITWMNIGGITNEVLCM